MEENVQNNGKRKYFCGLLFQVAQNLQFSAAIACYSDLVCTYGTGEGGHFFPDQYVSAAEKIISGVFGITVTG